MACISSLKYAATPYKPRSDSQPWNGVAGGLKEVFAEPAAASDTWQVMFAFGVCNNAGMLRSAKRHLCS